MSWLGEAVLSLWGMGQPPSGWARHSPVSHCHCKVWGCHELIGGDAANIHFTITITVLRLVVLFKDFFPLGLLNLLSFCCTGAPVLFVVCVFIYLFMFTRWFFFSLSLSMNLTEVEGFIINNHGYTHNHFPLKPCSSAKWVFPFWKDCYHMSAAQWVWSNLEEI